MLYMILSVFTYSYEMVYNSTYSDKENRLGEQLENKNILTEYTLRAIAK